MTGGEFLPGFEVGGANDYSDVFDYSAGSNDLTGGQFPSDYQVGDNVDYSSVADLSGTGDLSGSGDFSMGFATGGQFIVGGDGGTDTTPVMFMGTKGETVTITPNGVASPVTDSAAGVPSGMTPTGVVMPAAAAANPAPDPSQQRNPATTTTKIVNIQVQAGIQADSFLRSRAQIARGL
jgi:hypothetical protein